MNVLLLAAVLLGSEGTATRTIVVEPSIERIVWQVIAGGVKDACASGGWDDSDGGVFQGVRGSRDLLNRAVDAWARAKPQLTIDGQPRTGIISWLAAAHRVAGYALDRSDAGAAGTRNGSVCYAYRLRVRGFNVWRSTRIEDGHVSLVTDVYGRLGPKGELYRVHLEVCAVEGIDGTRITGVATGYSTIGRRCRLVSRIASRVIADAMGRELLAVIERGGREWYSAGGLTEVLK